MDDAWWRRPLTDLVAGGRVIFAGGVAAGWSALVPIVRELGATDVLIVATEGLGAGAIPADTQVVVWEPGPDVVGMMPRLRAALDVLHDLPDDLTAAIDAFDPDHDAVIFAVFLNHAPRIAGRPAVAFRRPEWLALEDKTVVDGLLDRAGVARAPSVVVAVTDALAARHAVDVGAGTVWAGDAREGFHGGATLTRWVVDDAEAAAATAELGRSCDTVRVMPFLDGVPCSIHGIVLPDGVAVLRPVEMVTLRRGRDLVYAGCATYWDPPAGVRDEMREAARLVGEQLRSEVGFRGAFTLDGVVTVDGFRPTEVNPRFGAGFNVMARSLASVPLLLALDLVVAGHELDISAGDLEAGILDDADLARGGGTWRIMDAWTPVAERGAAFDDGAWRWATDGETADGQVVAGERFARILFDPARTPIGPSVAPRAAAFWNWFEHEQGRDQVVPLTPAPEVSE
jgi:hypothetical protein